MQNKAYIIYIIYYILKICRRSVGERIVHICETNVHKIIIDKTLEQRYTYGVPSGTTQHTQHTQHTPKGDHYGKHFVP